MGLFGFVSDAWHGVTHVASDAWNGATHLASDAWHGVEGVAGDAWHGLESGFGAIGHFFATRWKTILAVTVGTIAFAAICFFAPEALPLLGEALTSWVVVAGAGAASGALSRTVLDLLYGKSPGWDVLKSAAISAVLSVAAAGVLRYAAPLVSRFIPALEPLTARLSTVGSNASEDAQNAENAATGVVRPDSIPRILVRAVPKGRLILGLVAGDVGNKAPDQIAKLPAEYQKEKARIDAELAKLREKDRREEPHTGPITPESLTSLAPVIPPPVTPAVPAAPPSEPSHYVVVSGDTLTAIALANDVSLAALEAANPQIGQRGSWNLIVPGDVLEIPSSPGFVHALAKVH